MVVGDDAVIEVAGKHEPAETGHSVAAAAAAAEVGHSVAAVAAAAAAAAGAGAGSNEGLRFAMGGRLFGKQRTVFAAVPINQVHPNPKQPRQYFDEKALDDLADSINVTRRAPRITVAANRPTPPYASTAWSALASSGLARRTASTSSSAAAGPD